MWENMQPNEFLKYTKVNNCGKCGYLACLAFAVSVTKGGEDPFKCPYVNKNQLGNEFSSQYRGVGGLDGVAQTLKKKDLALVTQLKEKIVSISLKEVAQTTGCEWNSDEPNVIRFIYLGKKVKLSTDGIYINECEPEDPRDQILLYNYIFFRGGKKPKLDWNGIVT